MKNIRYPQVLDIDGNLVAILNKAYKIGYTKIKNGLWTCSFSLPLNDSKVYYVQPKYHIELFDYDKRIGRFIVNPKRTIKNDSAKEVTFHCEHVLSTLHSDILFRYHQYSNYTTKEVLEFLMENQEVKHWEIGTVEFTRYFDYSWENEDSLLNATMSTTKPFDVPFLWTWDDTSYPFTLNLVQPPDVVKDIIVAGKNLKGIELEEDPTNICTRIYPLGSGEGVNQLDITKVNGGVPYLQDDAAVEKYGIHKRVWVDSRFEDAPSLKASGQAILDKFKEPIVSCAIDAIDYSLKNHYNLEGYDVGDLLQVFDLDTKTNTQLRVEKMSKSNIYGQPDQLSMEIGNRIADIGMTWADLQKKQLINETYSQGATNIDSRDFADNCDSSFPAIIRFPIPEDVVNINQMTLTFETQKYRAYSKAVAGGGAIVAVTESGGGIVQTSSAENYRPGLDGHNHGIPNGTQIALFGGGYEVWEESGQHEHTITIPHHTHNLTLPNHKHDIEYGIFEYPAYPGAVTITVDGNLVPVTSTSVENLDIIPYLAKDSNGNIVRGRYAEIIITPNTLARINATVTSRLFIQSRIGGTY